MPRIGAGRRYAEAVFELAERDGSLDVWERDLAVLAGLAADDRIVRAFDNPVTRTETERLAYGEAAGTQLSTQARNLATRLVERGRFGILVEVKAEYDALVRKSRGIVAATVTTPRPLSEAQLAGVRTRTEELAGAKVDLATAIDPTLVGGLTIRIGDRLIDASVRGRLERLRGALIQGTS